MCKECKGHKEYKSFDELPQELKDKFKPTKITKQTKQGFLNFINELNKHGDVLIGNYVNNSTKTLIKFGKCGHIPSEGMRSNNYMHGNRCAICHSMQVEKGLNDLATKRPQLAKEWHPIKNGDLTPQKVTFKSNKKVWWLGKCGHEWEATISSRSHSNDGCPFCSNHRVLEGFNDLATTHPELAKQWHPTKNGTLIPKDILKGYNKKVWWQCEYGHEWEATVSNRSRGNGCPYCSGHKTIENINNLAITHPHLVKYFLNKEDTIKYKAQSGKEVELMCPICKYIKRMRIQDLTKQGFSCPCCSDGISYPEKVMALILKILNIKFKKQHKFDGYKYLYDFYLIDYDIILEVHGKQHYEGNRHSSWKSYEEEHENDLIKYDIAVLNDYEYNKSYFIIDAKYSNIDYIKQNIYNCLFFQQFNLDSIDWQDIDVKAQSSLKINICKYWKEQKEINKNLTTRELEDIFDLAFCTIIRYLEWGTKKGLCIYKGEAESKASKERRSKFVYLIKPNGDKWFDKAMSQSELATISKIGTTTISRNRRNKMPLGSKGANNVKYDSKYIGSYVVEEDKLEEFLLNLKGGDIIE